MSISRTPIGRPSQLFSHSTLELVCAETSEGGAETLKGVCRDVILGLHYGDVAQNVTVGGGDHKRGVISRSVLCSSPCDH